MLKKVKRQRKHPHHQAGVDRLPYPDNDLVFPRQKNESYQGIRTRVEFSMLPTGNVRMVVDRLKANEMWKGLALEFQPPLDAYEVREGLNVAIDVLEKAIPK